MNCGHGIGIDVHEFPALSPANEGVALEDGMILCVESDQLGRDDG
jgi:peptidase M24-like protein